jgi:hypothetical protein
VREWGEMLTTESVEFTNGRCTDLLTPPAPHDCAEARRHNEDCAGGADMINFHRGNVASLFNASACGGSCPTLRPMCHGGECIVPTCATLAAYCESYSEVGFRARQFCPLTCGCDSPLSPLVLSTTKTGCPPICSRMPTHTETMRMLPCADTAPTPGSAFRSVLDAIPNASQRHGRGRGETRSGTWLPWSEQAAVPCCGCCTREDYLICAPATSGRSSNFHTSAHSLAARARIAPTSVNV